MTTFKVQFKITNVKQRVGVILYRITHNGENTSVLTKRVLGKKLSRYELSKHIEKQCGVSLNDIVCIAKLHKTQPNIVEAIVRLQKNSKLKDVVFNNVT